MSEIIIRPIPPVKERGKRLILRKVPKETEQYTVFDVYNEIHKTDTSMIDKDINHLKNLLLNNAKPPNHHIRVKDLDDIKKLLLKTTISSHKRNVAEKVQCSEFQLRKAHGNSFEMIKPRTTNKTTRASKTTRTPQSCITHRYKPNKDWNLTARVNRRQTHSKRQQFIRKLDKIINQKEETNKNSDLHKRLLIESYRHERIKQRQSILDSIDTDKPNVLKAWYNYKLNSIKDYEKEMLGIGRNIGRALTKSARFVSKLGRNLSTARKLRSIGKS